MYPPAPVVCPHCRGLVAAIPHLGGHPVSCPHCRLTFLMPVTAPYPYPMAPPPAAPGKVRVTVTMNYVFRNDPPQADVGAAVVLFPTDQRGSISVEAILPFTGTPGLNRLATELRARNVHIGRVGGHGQLVLNNVQPGRYELLVWSHRATGLNEGRSREILEGIFSGLSAPDAHPFDFSGGDIARDSGMKLLEFGSSVLNELEVLPGQETEFSHHFLG